MAGQSNIINEILDTPAEKLDLHNAAYQASLLDFLTEWCFYKDALFPRCEHSDWALGLRIVFHFDNDWMLVLPTDTPAVITHLNDEIKKDNPMFEEIMDDMFDRGEWEYQRAVNGWTRSRYLVFEDPKPGLYALLKKLETMWGKPKLVLPFLEYVELTKDDAEYFTEEADKKKEKGEDVDSVYKIVRLLVTIANNEIEPYLPWETELTFGSDYIPEYSAAGRLFRLGSDLEDAGWFVNFDEHCGACAAPMFKDFEEQNPGKPYHTFMTWGQSAGEEWFPDGSVEVNVFLTEEAAEAIVPFLVKNGFLDERDVEDGVPEHLCLDIDGYSHF